MDGIDLNKLSIEDQKRVQEIQKQYETSMQEFYKKGYRILIKKILFLEVNNMFA